MEFTLWGLSPSKPYDIEHVRKEHIERKVHAATLQYLCIGARLYSVAELN
jgi:hypothetical protein